MRYKNLVLPFACCFVLSLFAAGQETSALPLPDPGNVTLTLAEYNHLIELAAHPPKNPELAPLPFSIQHADLKLRVEKDAIRGTVELDGEVLRKGISKVPLTSGMTILDARLNGKAVPLIQENGTHAALLPTGEFSIALDAGLPLRIEAGRASFTLPAPAAGSVQVSLVIPGDHSFANVTPGLITGRKSEDGHTVIEATLVPGQPANFWWATREVAAPVVPRETRFLCDTKTMVSVSEAEMRVAVLADVTVVQGEPSQFQVMLPAAYEITGVTGSTLDASETQSGVLTLKVNAPNQRSHQFLISMERSINDANAEAPFLIFKGAQRETGELLVEGAGTMEITAKEAGGLKRIDVKEANPYLRSMARFPAQAAFRYHRQPNETPSLALAWVRFPDSAVLAAVAESAQVTTLVTSEGKSLTEIKLMMKNQAQPFLKVGLAAGASILSAEVAGERVKPVQGVDGSRIPLLRPGFRPADSYTVSFVFMHSGAPFAKKGGAELSLPSMDIPINLLSWEVFLPEQYKVKDFGGDVVAANRVPAPFREDEYAMRQGESRDLEARMMAMPGQIGGYVSDPSGAMVANARVTITSVNGSSRSVASDSSGRFVVGGMPSGAFKARVEVPGFKTGIFDLNYDANQPSLYSFPLRIASTNESIEVSAQAVQMQAPPSTMGGPIYGVTDLTLYGKNNGNLPSAAPVSQQNASANVLNLQRRVAGVLPVPVEVPRAGTSFAFVRPLVVDEDTKVTFSYKSR
ncbi:MAG TPA: carboxypeptidase-like regulatory domain-containing protein [Candidatus Sulfotelmatobacter sp.]